MQLQSAVSLLAAVASLCATTTSAFPQPYPQELPQHLSKRATTRYTASTAFQLPNGTWVENLVVRQNGQVLATTTTPTAALYLYDPARPRAAPVLIHNFTSVSSVFGIAEYSPDIFGVVGGNRTNGTNVLFRVNLTRFGLDGNTSAIHTPATVSVLSPITGATFLNGLTYWNSTTLLAADSTQGVVWGIDTLTGASRIALRDNLFTGLNGGIGINGVTARGNYLYFSNTGQQKFGRVEITDDGVKRGNATTIANVLLDDFTIGSTLAYGASNGGNAIVTISPNGTVNTILGGRNSTAVLGPTSIRFGRKGNADNLFITTSGGRNSPVNGYSEGGKLIQLNITTTN